MGILNWFSNNKTQSSKNGKITAKKVLDFAKTYEELKPFFALFIHCFKSILDSEKEIEQKVQEIQAKTQQNLKEDQLFKELWILRYVCLHVWFFDLKPPKSKTELSDELLVINSALKSVLKEKDKLDYMSWLKNGLFEFADGELNFNSLKSFRKNFSDKLADKIPHIAFECTEGRLGGELHDFVIEMVMTTIQEDQKVFSMTDDNALTEEEAQNIKKAIAEMSEARHKAGEDFMNSLG
ncbi:hypothetical protein COS93_01940 [bacterium (Candidatus Gribaldobacteria) CG07_land_8_20_14_0_80_33_18]|uniref:Uncharacterized protein n=1 Tax=bacterium (Candidatus Gribaldobacteria) CG07_land_8_20_14_0_80_33_18 TaxID=2014272 RepID=A0A2M6Z2R4_9BACT|nr:MAG: hypothetical protein COS93_01940 [bacterium (Candidatus Gribaldobacteria) CG07_land_8_20_14_0_80_33_18]